MAETLRARFEREMTVQGYAERTRETYLNNVKLMVERTGTHPARLTGADLTEYFASLIRDHGACSSTYRQHVSAVALFYRTVLHRNCGIFASARGQRRKRLPLVLSLNELHRLLSRVRSPYHYTGLTFLYSCGLRISELTAARPDWIVQDSTRLHIHHGKGGSDRLVPLPKRIVQLLREHWRRERLSGPLLFPSPLIPGASISDDAVRHAVRAAATDAGIRQRVTPHTLRHCYATHLLERGVDIQLIRKFLGHKSIESTSIYLHLSDGSMERAQEALDAMTGSL